MSKKFSKEERVDYLFRVDFKRKRNSGVMDETLKESGLNMCVFARKARTGGIKKKGEGKEMRKRWISHYER